METEGHLDILKQGVARWNHWRRRYPAVRPRLAQSDLRGLYLAEINLRDSDLMGADLSWTILIFASLTYADLSEANLSDANLNAANLSWARLREANLHGADLRGADLSGADLVGANLRGADLSSANLSGAELVGANLSRANLTMAELAWTNFDGCFLEGTLFGNVDLSLAKGLPLVHHLGPSTIGIDTLYRSAGNIPPEFMRDCGVPRAIIGHVYALRENPLHYYSCYVVYGPKERPFAERLCQDLREHGVRAWPLPTERGRGEPDWRETDRTLALYDKLVAVCSESSLQHQPFAAEIARALQREEEEKARILFPVSVDGYVQANHSALAERWQQPHKEAFLHQEFTDFAGWEEDAAKYAAALRRLLAALQSRE